MEGRCRILLIEDSKKISELIKIYMGTHYDVLIAESGEEGLEILGREQISLVLLDIVLPGMDGLEVLTQIRKDMNIPVIIVSSKEMDMDIILGLKMGADDYLTKPFNPLELSARVEAQLRRMSMLEKGSVHCDPDFLQLRNLKLDLGNPMVLQDGRQIDLMPTEYKILKLLMMQANQVLTKKQIYESVWEDTYAYDDNTIMVHISKLREKLESESKQRYIKTIRGLGYRFEREE
ncbi:MAG: response regulator transcription factor [Tissierellia bacterium]|nr:response regulator transcription factor [Tissierellia bacterium]